MAESFCSPCEQRVDLPDRLIAVASSSAVFAVIVCHLPSDCLAVPSKAMAGRVTVSLRADCKSAHKLSIL